MKRIPVLLVAAILLFSCAPQKHKITDFSAFVDPMIGTDGFGHTFPGATVPFGMVQLSPDTRLTGWEGCSGYHYSDREIYGFSHTHLSGTGCSDYGDILLMPVVKDIEPLNTFYKSSFKHENESAKAGFYSVKLDNGIQIELTASKRVGFHKYIFPKGNKNNFVVLDLQHRDEVLASSLEIKSDTLICGMRTSKSWANEQILYFAMSFSKPFSQKRLYLNDSLKDLLQSEGYNIKAAFQFLSDTILVKVGISAVSMEGAMLNMQTEIPSWDFEKVKENAKTEWNKELGKIEVEGGTQDQKRIFYTALYHCMIAPNLYIDVDKQYRGRDLKVHKAENFDYYTVFSLWDTYRALHPLFTIIDQKRTNDFINTFLLQYKQGGLMPIWELSACETDCMIGYHSVSVIADAYLKGIKNYDTTLAFEAMKASADSDKFGLDVYKKYGCIIGDLEHESVSKTLEYAYDDWCIAQIAKQSGNSNDYKEYIQRAQYYKNLYNPNTGFIQPRMNGGWATPFNPAEVSSHYTEANGWQYGYYVPQDVTGMYRLMGGKEVLEKMLDSMFHTNQSLEGRKQVDISGLIGQYAHGNEPSHHAAYLYNYLNKPWKTQAMVRRILKEMYHTQPDGICGNDDCGQMSAWYVLSAMGFYPVCPGSNDYIIGSPIFEKVTIHLENGKNFIIEAKKQSDKNAYIQKANLQGKKYRKGFITHQDIIAGGQLEFVMGDKPNKEWASRDEDIPVSAITDDPIVITPSIVYEGIKSFSGHKKIALQSPDKNVKIYYTLDGSEPSDRSALYSGPFNLSQTATIKAAAYSGEKKSFVVEGNFYSIPAGRTVKLLTPYNPQYTAGGAEGLIDHVRGKKNWRLGSWQGYGDGQSMDAIIDLGNVHPIHYLGAGFLQDISPWIWFPTQVEFLSSDDGEHFTSLKIVKNTTPENQAGVMTKEFGFNTNIRARYIRVKAQNKGVIPDWHISKGEKAWLFVDEIIIK